MRHLQESSRSIMTSGPMPSMHSQQSSGSEEERERCADGLKHLDTVPCNGHVQATVLLSSRVNL
jgi:hypothetical protein